MAMRNKDFAVFILTHGRADGVVTVQTLKRQGYTGPLYLVIDNEDDQEQAVPGPLWRYRCVQFDKAAIAETFDEGDNLTDRRTR